MLCRESMAVYCENHMKHTNTHFVSRNKSFGTLMQVVAVITIEI
jgi:hypothetical protein